MTVACQDVLFTYASVAFLVVSNDKGNNTSLGLQISVHSITHLHQRMCMNYCKLCRSPSY